MVRILLSARLGELRMTQKELARITGIRRATINAMHNEVIDKVSLEDLWKICKALHIDIPQLLILDDAEYSEYKVLPAEPGKRT